MKASHSYWQLSKGLPQPHTEHGRDVDLDAALELFDDIAARSAVEELAAGYGGGRGFVSFTEFPHAFHIYFERVQGSATYELFLTNESVSGRARLGTLRQAVTMFITGHSPLEFLRTQSVEVHGNDG